MEGLRRERRETDSDVLGALSARRAVSNSFTRPGDDGLAGVNFVYAALGFDAHGPAQDDRDFLELGLLCGLFPAAGRDHAGDADVLVAGRDAPDEFFDPLGLISGGRDNA